MINAVIRFLAKSELPQILPLVQLLNPGIPTATLEQRLKQMTDTAYRCVGVFVNDSLVGVCGIWENVRFYSGRQLEVDNVIILEEYRSSGIGKQMMEWIYGYAKETGCESVELNTYVSNPRSHKFYYNEGFVILGFHMKKNLM